MTHRYALLGAAIVLTAACSPAHAAEGVAVDLTGIAAAAVSGIFAVLGAVLLAIIQAKIKNKQMADLLSAAVANSLGKIQQATMAQVQHATFLHPELPPQLAVGAQYVLDHAPEAMAHFGITAEAVADKIEAKIGLSEIATNLAVSGSNTPAVAAPLAPIPPSPPGTTTADLNREEIARHQGA